MRYRIVSCFLGFLFIAVSAIAQNSIEAGGFFGASSYYGELSQTHGSFEEVGLAFGAMGRFMFNRNLGVKAFAGWLKLRGSDATLKEEVNYYKNPRNWSVRTNLLEISVHFEYHPLGKGRRNIFRRFNRNQLSPYLFFGGGVAMGDSKVSTPPIAQDLFPEENDTSSFVVFPLGAGLRYDVSEYLILSLELGKRAVFSDYLDGISVNGDQSTNDWYMFGGIMVSFLIGAQIEKRY